MSSRTVFIAQQPIKLDSADLIQAGGEGLVFAHGRDQVIKLYHQPHSAHADKLNYLWQNQLEKVLPTAVYWPHTAVTNAQKELVGYTMRRLPPDWQPLKRLSNPTYARRHALTLPDILHILRHAWQVLHTLHQQNIIVGDLNDHNIFFNPHDPHQKNATAWLDTDSYQIGPYPCPVALQTFLDPQLYHIADFAQQPVFTVESDWYAFFVLLIKSVLHVHPYGGTHHTHKTLTSRAAHRISLLNGTVTYPPQAQPPDILSDSLHSHLRRVFEKGERPLFPSHLIDDYAQSLKMCAHCGQPFPQTRPHCPHCQRQNTPPPPTPAQNMGAVRCLFQTEGHIVQVWLQYETQFAGQRRFRAVVQQDKLYSLVYAGLGGPVNDMPLFTGQTGYQFGYFAGHLVVNPPQRTQLLVLDVSGLEPTRLALLDTAQFGDTAVFATTPQHLYRLANGYIMQASVRDGLLVEEVVGTAYPNQTRLWGSPFNDMIAGVYRSFGEYTFFYRTAVGQWHEYRLALQPGESIQEMFVVFNDNGQEADLFLHTRQQGQTFYKSTMYALAQNPLTLPEITPFQTAPARRGDTLYVATNQGLLREKKHIQSQLLERLVCKKGVNTAVDIDLPLAAHHQLHTHDRGLLVQTDQHLFLVEA